MSEVTGVEIDNMTSVLLYSISGGVFVILIIMVVITCLLAVKLKQRPQQDALKAQREFNQKQLDARRMTQKLQPMKSVDEYDGYLEPRKDIRNKSMKMPGQSSPTGSAEHVYDDPEMIQGFAMKGLRNSVSSGTSSHYEKIDSFANAAPAKVDRKTKHF